LHSVSLLRLHSVSLLRLHSVSLLRLHSVSLLRLHSVSLLRLHSVSSLTAEGTGRAPAGVLTMCTYTSLSIKRDIPAWYMCAQAAYKL